MSESTTSTEGAASTDAGTGEGAGAPASTPTPTSGAQPDAGALAAELEAANRRARDEQGRADRFKAELDSLRKGSTPDPQPTPTEGLTLEAFRAELRRTREFDLATVALRDEFKSADPGLFSDPADRFDSVEQLRAAAEDSHRSIEDRVKAQLAEQEQALRARYAERYGPLEPDAPDASTPTGDGLPTPEQLARMSMSQLDALEAEHPGAIDRIIASASRKDG